MAHSSVRSLWPREHGAYGQLALPLLTALLSGRPTGSAYLYAISAACAFLAHEPLLVLLGHRGSRARREDAGRASTRLALLSAGALLCGGLALTSLGPPAYAAVLLLLGGALGLGPIIWRKQERTDWGESAAACALSACAIPVALSSGVSVQMALGAWGVWSFGLVLNVLSLRAAGHKERRTRLCASWFTAPSLLFLAFCLIAGASLYVAVAALPLVGAAFGLCVWPPHPRHFRRVGWLLMGSCVSTGLLLVCAARGVRL